MVAKLACLRGTLSGYLGSLAVLTTCWKTRMAALTP
jgi:hypothetical protein